MLIQLKGKRVALAYSCEHLEGALDLVNIQSGDRRALKLLKEPNACTEES